MKNTLQWKGFICLIKSQSMVFFIYYRNYCLLIRRLGFLRAFPVIELLDKVKKVTKQLFFTSLLNYNVGPYIISVLFRNTVSGQDCGTRVICHLIHRRDGFRAPSNKCPI